MKHSRCALSCSQSRSARAGIFAPPKNDFGLEIDARHGELAVGAFLDMHDRVVHVAVDDKTLVRRERAWELKILLLVLIFVYASFKFSWSIRQFGLCSMLVGATRKPPQDAEQYATHIDRITTMVTFANGNFNNGLRAYYFGVAALSWFLHPVLMIAVTIGVVYVLHQREFRSKTLQALLGE